MIATISKDFTFEAAHRIVGGYQGKCASLHGHSYKLTVILEGSVDELGMVKDYNDLNVVKEWVDKFLDHATIVSDKDKQLIDLLNSMDDPQQKTYIIPYCNTTAENLAAHIYFTLNDYVLERGCTWSLKAVVVKETEKTSATFANVQ